MFMRTFWTRTTSRLSLLFASVAFVAFASCIAYSPLDPERTNSSWYRDGRYQNKTDDSELTARGFGTVIMWKLFGDRDPPAVEPLPEGGPAIQSRTTEDLLAPEGALRLVWIGHASVWIAANVNGKRTHIITDPIFDAPLWMDRYTPMPIAPEALPRIDAVLVSHAHRDHLDWSTLREIQERNPEVRIYLPSGLGRWARKEGLRGAVILEWEQKVAGDGYALEFLPAFHWSRMGLNDHLQFHWGSYAIQTGGRSIYFSGDTGFSPHFAETRAAYPGGFDVALMPVGAFKPRWFMRPAHIDPPEALEATRIIGGRFILPIHWATFPLGDDLPQEAGLYLGELLKTSRIPGRVWTPGEIVDL